MDLLHALKGIHFTLLTVFISKGKPTVYPKVGVVGLFLARKCAWQPRHGKTD